MACVGINDRLSGKLVVCPFCEVTLIVYGDVKNVVRDGTIFPAPPLDKIEATDCCKTIVAVPEEIVGLESAVFTVMLFITANVEKNIVNLKTDVPPVPPVQRFDTAFNAASVVVKIRVVVTVVSVGSTMQLTKVFVWVVILYNTPRKKQTHFYLKYR